MKKHQAARNRGALTGVNGSRANISALSGGKTEEAAILSLDKSNSTTTYVQNYSEMKKQAGTPNMLLQGEMMMKLGQTSPLCEQNLVKTLTRVKTNEQKGRETARPRANQLSLEALTRGNNLRTHYTSDEYNDVEVE